MAGARDASRAAAAPMAQPGRRLQALQRTFVGILDAAIPEPLYRGNPKPCAAHASS